MSKVKWLVLTAGVALAIGGGIYAWTEYRKLFKKAIDIVADGGERVLQPPMRPLRGGTRVLLFVLDGVGVDELQRALESRAMPRLRALLGAKREGGVFAYGYSVADCLSILPSTTIAAWSSVFTGEPPARTGVPGNEWFVREEMRFYAPAPVSITEVLHAIKMLSDGMDGDAIKALVDAVVGAAPSQLHVTPLVEALLRSPS